MVFIFMYLAVVLLLGFTCVALLYYLFSIQQKDIEILKRILRY